MPSGLETDDVK